MSVTRVLAATALTAALSTMACPALAQDADTIARAVQVREAAASDTLAMDYVTQLTTRFGARPAGSSAEQAAAAWAADYMRAHGFQNVRIETFPLVGWERGEEAVSLIGPRPQRLVAAALGHSPGTHGVIEAEVVRFDSFEALQAVPDGSLSGKIAYVDAGQLVPMQDGAGYGPLTRIRGAGPGVAAAKGAVAFIMRSVGSDEHRMPHTGTTRYVEGRVPVPAFALSAPDADQVSRLIGMGETVRLSLMSTAHVYDTVSQNVIGDIPGTSRPGEVIVLGSHMDSWDLGTGAIDDGAGGAITLAAAKLIANAGGADRTVRVILYGSEEVSQPTDRPYGGQTYALGVQADGTLAQHILAGESDFGADRIYNLQLPPGAQGSAFQRAATQVLYPIGVLASSEAETSGGADVGPLARLGVPVFSLSQDGSRYFDLHHTADDTLDKIDPEQLRQNVAAWAALIMLVADSDVDFRALRPAPAPAN